MSKLFTDEIQKTGLYNRPIQVINAGLNMAFAEATVTNFDGLVEVTLDLSLGNYFGLDMNKCNTNISSYFNPLPHEPRNELIGKANDPLSEPGIDFRSTPPGPYSTNQLAYKFNMA